MDYRTEQADSPYNRLLPIGGRMDPAPLLERPLSSFEAVTLKPSEPMRVAGWGRGRGNPSFASAPQRERLASLASSAVEGVP